MIKAYNLQPSSLKNVGTVPTVLLEAHQGTVAITKRLDLVETIKFGRQISPKSPPNADNGIYDSKVLSRQHAEMWSENGRVRRCMDKTQTLTAISHSSWTWGAAMELFSMENA